MKYIAGVLVASLVYAAGMLPAGAASTGAGNWPAYGDGPAHNSVNRAEQTLSPSTVGGLHPAATYSGWTPNSSDTPYQVVVGNYGYSVTQTATAKLGYLTAFHLPSGTVAWSKLIYHYYNFWNYVPAVNKGVIYVGGDTAMYAFNATTGRKIWETLVSGVPLFNEVTVNGSMVYADDYYGGTVYAFDAGSGAIVWSAKPSGCCLIGPVSIANGLAYVGSDPVTVYNATTGAPEFSLPSSTSTVSVPVSGGKAFVQTVDHLEAYDAGTGVLLWSSPTVSGNSYSSLSPAVDGSTVVVSTPQNVIAFDTSTGSRLWTVDGGASDADFADPAIANGMVYVGSLTNGLQAIDEATGTVLYTGGSDCGSPIISDAAVYSFCSDVMTVFTL